MTGAPRPRRRALATAAALAGALLGACAQQPTPGSVPESPRALAAAAARGLRAEDLQTQSLFRVSYDGREASGALRLILKLETAERYRIETKDRLGRGLWRIEAEPAGAVLIDDRRRIFCSSDRDLRIPEIALESLPLADLPAILFDRLPADLEPVGAGGREFRDRRGRRWTVTASGEEVSAWTFWEEGEPLLWWLREAAGEAVLSHRAGAQLRWKRVALESLPDALEPLELDSGYARIDCEDWPLETGGT